MAFPNRPFWGVLDRKGAIYTVSPILGWGYLTGVESRKSLIFPLVGSNR